jgi:hypothetical protein
VNASALIIGATAIAAIFVVWKVASKPAVPPPAAADKCAVSYQGASVSCGAIKAGAAAVKKAAVGIEHGIASVPGALFGTNPTGSLWASATGAASGSGFGVKRGTA